MNTIELAKGIVRDAERYPWEYEQGEAKENYLLLANALLRTLECLKTWRAPLVRPAKGPDANTKIVCFYCKRELSGQGVIEHSISCPYAIAQRLIAGLEGKDA